MTLRRLRGQAHPQDGPPSKARRGGRVSPWLAVAGFLLAALLGLTLPAVELTQAQAAQGPNPYATSTLTKTYDGTGFVGGKPSSASTFVNGDNGFYPGDNGPNDGNVSSRDYVGYKWETKLTPGPLRSVEVKLVLPEYLEFNKALNSTFCVNAAGVEASYNGDSSAPGCVYQVKAGQSFFAVVDVTLTAKDTSGAVQENQVLKTSQSVPGQPPYSSDSAQPVTVLSAPSADLLVRPAECTALGSCSAAAASVTSSSFVIFPQPIKWRDYDSTKGATATTPWTAQLDVSAMPEGTTYEIGGAGVEPDAAGLISLPETVGELTVDYTVPPNWGGGEFEEGETRDFPVHLIVPDGAFATEDYLNNGNGWEPGQGEGKAFPTYDDRGSGARAGYYYPNNDWTMAKVYMPLPPPPPGPDALFRKTIARPWNGGEALWEPGNTTFTEGGATTTFTSDGRADYRRVTENTQIRSQLEVHPANNPDVVADATVVLMDTWDPTELHLDGTPYLVDAEGVPLEGYTQKVEWSPTVIGETGADANNSSGWFQTDPASADPKKVKSVRAIVEGVSLGEGAPSQITLVIPQKVVDPYPQENPGAYVDTMYASAGGEVVQAGNDVVPVTKPELRLGLTGLNAPVELDRAAGTVLYTYSPTVTGLTSSTNKITGEATFTLDPCISGVDLTGQGWQVVEKTLGNGCMTEGAQQGSLVLKPSGDGWVPGNDYNSAAQLARLPKILFEATINPLVIGPVVVSGTWDLTDPEGALPTEPVVTTTVAGDFELVSPDLGTTTSRVEIDSPMHFLATVTAKNAEETSSNAEAVLIFPGQGNDAEYLDALETITGNTLYRDGGHPLESDYQGSYLISQLEVDAETSVAGATLECTRDANPSMDPAQNTWDTDCTDDASSRITAAKVTQPAGSESAGVRLNVELSPTGNEVGDLYLVWLGPIYVDGEPVAMVWPVDNVVVASTISGYTYWDGSGRGADRTNASAPIKDMTVALVDETGQVVATTEVDAQGYYEFTDLHSGTYTVRVPEIGEPGGPPATLASRYYPGRRIPVHQSFSYQGKRGDQATNQSTPILLGRNDAVSYVNFGYFAADPYSDLLKMPAEVQCDGDNVQCDVAWEVIIKNDGTSFEASEITQVSAGGSHSLALTTSGTVYAWGKGESGQLGDGAALNRSSPVQVLTPGIGTAGAPLTGVIQVSAGEAHSLALTSSGTVYSWGAGDFGGLGNGLTEDLHRPVQVLEPGEGTVGDPLEDLTQISAGNGHSLALTAEGSVFAWGKGTSGQLGNGEDESVDRPVQVLATFGSEPLTEISQVSAGGQHSLALTSSGAVYAWGNGELGQLGDGLGGSTSRPVQVLEPGIGTTGDPLTGVTQVSAGANHSLALSAQNTVLAWGDGSSGQLGNGGSGSANRPVHVLVPRLGPFGDVLTGVSEISAGGNHSLALTDASTVLAWGGNDFGQLGEGGVSNESRPVQVLDAEDGYDPLTGVRQVSAGGDFSLASAGPEELYAWGRGGSGSLGNGSTANENRPTLVKTPWTEDAPANASDPLTLTGGKLTESASDALYDFNVQFSQDKKAVAIAGRGAAGHLLWGVITEDGEVYQREVGGETWAPIFLPDGKKAKQISGDGDKNNGSWGVVTETGEVYEYKIHFETWSTVPLPNGEKAKAITGGGIHTRSWAVVTQSGKVYDRKLSQTQWSTTPLPAGEVAVAVSGNGSAAGYWGVVTESGKVYQRKISDAEWTTSPLPTGVLATSIAGEGEGNSSYWGILTDSGQVYRRQTVGTQWFSMPLPTGEEGTHIVGGEYTYNSVTHWGVITKSGKVYQRLASASSWSELVLPKGLTPVEMAGTGGGGTFYWGFVTEEGEVYQRTIQGGPWSAVPLPDQREAQAVTGGGASTSFYWGVVTKSGEVFQRRIDGDTWSSVPLPDDQVAAQITGNGATTTSYWGVITESGRVYQRTVGGSVWFMVALPDGEKAKTITGNGQSAAYYWAVTTETGGVYQRAVGGDTWIALDLPEDERAAAITGNGLGGDTTYWAVVTETGKVYQRTKSADTWTDTGFPAGQAAVAITGAGEDRLNYWGVVTQSGEVYQAFALDNAWSAQPMPEGEEALIISGAGQSSSQSWGVTTKSGNLYQRQTNRAEWAIQPLPEGQKAVAMAGFGGESDYWGVIAESGRVYQRQVAFSERLDPPIRGQSSTASPVSEVQDGSFVTREYKLPNLRPGEELTATVTAKVNRKSYDADPEGVGTVIGNQAWETFNETPRTAPNLPEPPLPSYDGLLESKYGQWVGNPTCSATEGWVTPGDQCGQVYAQVPPTRQSLGSLAGYVFWDEDRTGIQTPSDPMVVGAKVFLYQGVNGTFTDLVGETFTDGDGHYSFQNLVPSIATASDGYYVAFTPVKNPLVSSDGGANSASMLEPGESWAYTTQYDEAPYFGDNRSASNNDGYTKNVAVQANQTTQPVNAGLAVYRASVVVNKGTMVEEALTGSSVATLDPENPGFTEPIKVEVVATNNGQEPVGGLVFSDTLVSGPKVAWETCTISDPASEQDLGETSWQEDEFTFAFPTSETIAADGTLTCVGTLPPIGTDEFPEDPEQPLHEDSAALSGVGTVTGTPVEDGSRFEITQVELPEPIVEIEKGVAVAEVPGADCTDPSQAANKSLCSIESGTPSTPVEIRAKSPVRVTFRVSNVGDEILLDPTLEDTTTVGGAQVEDVVCHWPTKTVNGKLRNYLGTNENQVAVCVGSLTVLQTETAHQNQAEVFAVGEVSNRLTVGEAEFNAKTGWFAPPDFALPLTGGSPTLSFVLIVLIGGAAAVVGAYRNRVGKVGEVVTE